MWAQYKKTFWLMQAVIGAVTIGIGDWSRVPALALLFLLAMQFASVVGGLWAGRLKRRLMLTPCPPRIGS